MGHVVLGAPPLARYHLHERLLRQLRQRGHRVAVLALAPATRTFWRRQGEAVAQLAHGSTPPADWPLADLAPARRGRAWRRMAVLAAAIDAWFAQEKPDLLVLDHDRGEGPRLLQFAARRHGCRVLWLGDGLLPHTLQCDDRGLDGDAAIAGRQPRGFRVVPRDNELLAACLAHALAQPTPFALPRAPIRPPSLAEQLRDAAQTATADGIAGGIACLGAWREALAPRPAAEPPWSLPAAPYLAVLLQDDDDPRVRCDATDPPTAEALVRAAAAASRALGCDGRLAVVAAAGRHRARVAGHDALPASAAPEVAATALATVTINHPAACVALLAGTPVVRLGRAAYGIVGVTTLATLADLPAALAQALRRDRPALRARVLSWLFGYGHVWCSPTHPDHNGIAGLAQAIEQRLGAAEDAKGLRHRRGPSWPLTHEPRQRST